MCAKKLVNNNISSTNKIWVRHYDLIDIFAIDTTSQIKEKEKVEMNATTKLGAVVVVERE